MTKKLSRRDFLKGTGKVSAALAAIWAVGAGVPASPIEETPETDVVEEDEDIWNEECHPYHLMGGATMIFAHSEKHEWWK